MRIVTPSVEANVQDLEVRAECLGHLLPNLGLEFKVGFAGIPIKEIIAVFFTFDFDGELQESGEAVDRRFRL
jgi:hypothetical protein